MQGIYKSNFFISQRVLWAFAFLSSFGLYAVLVLKYRIVQPDLDEHIQFSNDMFIDWKVPAHPLFYFLIQLFSGFSKNLDKEIFAAFLIFSSAQFAKIWASHRLIQNLFGYTLEGVGFLLLILMQYCISFSFTELKFIVGQISPNYFHNGTLLVSMPFALLLLGEGYKFWEQPTHKKLLLILLFGFFTLLGKPSFLFCFIPVFPLFVLLRYKFSVTFYKSVIASAGLFACIVLQSLYLKFNPPNYVKSFDVFFMPFYQFGDATGHFKTIIFGGGIWLVGLILFPKMVNEKPLQLGLMLLVPAFTIAFLFVDMVNGDLYSNMTWQATIVTYMMIVIVLGAIYKPVNQITAWKKFLFACVIGAYLLYTIAYLLFAIGMHTLFV